MLKRVFAVAALALTPLFAPSIAVGEGEKAKPLSPDHPWHFSGLTGQHEIAQVQRGFQVYWERCMACHGMEFRRFWHLEKVGYDESYIQGVLLPAYFAQIGETYNPSNYSIENLPVSRVSGAPDLSHGVLAKGKTMEAGADYIYSLMLGYDRLNDAVKGRALETDLAGEETAFTQVGAPLVVRNEDGTPQSITTIFERDNFYLYEKEGKWIVRSYVEVQTQIQDFDADGVETSQTVNTFRLDESDAAHEAEYAENQEGYEPPSSAQEAWEQREALNMHEIANWTAGQFYNPFKSGGIISMASPLVALEAGHRTDFTAEELMADSSELELTSYWLFENQEAQQPLLDAVEEGRPLYEAALAAGGIGQDTSEARAYNSFKATRITPLLASMHPETKTALAEDVTAFLAWSSDINLNARKQVGVYVVLLFAILSILLYFYYREIARQEFAKQAKEGGPWDEHH